MATNAFIDKSKRRHFVTSYVQPVIQQYESKTVKELFKKNLGNQRSHYGRFVVDDFRNKWKPLCAIDTFRGEQR